MATWDHHRHRMTPRFVDVLREIHVEKKLPMISKTKFITVFASLDNKFSFQKQVCTKRFNKSRPGCCWLSNSTRWTWWHCYTRIHSLLVNGIVTALSRALWRVLSNKVIWVLGHCWVETPQIHTYKGDSVLSELFAPYCHGYAEWLESCQQMRFF